MDTSQYLSMFIDESNEHLQAISDCLLELEKQPDQLELVQQIFRSAHTLKGMSATMGFEDLASLTHKMENVLDLIRNEQLKLDKHIFDVLFQSLDALEDMVGDIVNGGSGEADVKHIVDMLIKIAEGDVKQSESEDAENSDNINLDSYQQAIVKQAIETGNEVYLINVRFDEKCVMKAVRAYMVLDAINPMGEVFITRPTVEEMEQDFDGDSFQIGLITERSEEDIEKSIMQISEVAEAKLTKWKQISDKETSNQPQKNDVSEKKKQKKEAPPAKQTKKDKQFQLNRTIRVDISRLDQVINLFSELLIDRARLETLSEEIKNDQLTDTIVHMTRISSELQELVLNLRMVPLETVFNRFPRMVRDLATSLDKDIDFIITGQETELDRTVIEELGDPLVHLLRNSLDHGIESKEERKQTQKPQTGTIHLRAYHSGNHVTIEIEDDGKGINREKVLATAKKRGIVTEEEAQSMSDEQVFQLLFASGFSTADKVSDISGRGVGLDVVKSKITSIGGEVRVSSQRGVGTKFSIQLPLTLSIISAMLFRLGEENYAIPLSSVIETAIYQKEQIQYAQGIPMLEFREHLIPLILLKDVLDYPKNTDEEEQELTVLIIRKGDRIAAAKVDEIYGQQDIVLKSLGAYLKDSFAVSGATILGDGQVALILDVNALII